MLRFIAIIIYNEFKLADYYLFSLNINLQFLIKK
jgi:hypothetical protein